MIRANQKGLLGTPGEVLPEAFHLAPLVYPWPLQQHL
jgi:hypothetical protein